MHRKCKSILKLQLISSVDAPNFKINFKNLKTQLNYFDSRLFHSHLLSQNAIEKSEWNVQWWIYRDAFETYYFMPLGRCTRNCRFLWMFTWMRSQKSRECSVNETRILRCIEENNLPQTREKLYRHCWY